MNTLAWLFIWPLSSIIALLLLPKLRLAMCLQTGLLTVQWVLIAGLCYLHQPLAWQVQSLHFFSSTWMIALQYDNLAGIMLLLIYTIGWIVQFYSISYLLNDPGQRRFMIQLVLVMISVSVLVLSANLATAFFGWQLIGFHVYWLLNHFHFRPAANRAAKKKFFLNRIGDVCFLLAVLTCYAAFGTTDFQSINHLRIAGGQEIVPILGLLLVAVMTKCAQFPFFIWLPDTMEAPTPVSALMHAGVINAGGMLLARLAPAYGQHHWLLSILVTIGLIGMVIGGTCLLVQPGVKRQLGFSTMAQMGFMLFQYGSGLVAGSVFHLISHGLIKASLFLRSGSGLKLDRLQLFIRQTPIAFAFSLLSLAAMMWIASYYYLADVLHQPAFLLIWVLTLWFFSRSIWSITTSWAMRCGLSLLGIILICCYAKLLLWFAHFVHLPMTISTVSRQMKWFDMGVMLCFSLCLYQAGWLAKKCPGIYRGFYRLLYHEFYIESWLRRVWLAKLRYAGDILLTIRFNRYQQLGLILLLLGLVLSPVVYHNQAVAHCVFLLFLILSMVLLLAANRTKLFAAWVYYLSLAELAYVLSWLALGGRLAWQIICYHGFNIGLLLLNLRWLKQAHQQHAADFTLSTEQHIQLLGKNRFCAQNKLPMVGVYLAASVFALLGLPGTASFISEASLMNRVLPGSSSVDMILVLIHLLLLSMICLHCLQDYVFNSSLFSRLRLRLPLHLHAGLISAIFINIIFGIWPDLLQIRLL